ncbi:hypothetical protein [Natronorarus salvus]|uniref:hypothetical protein n=1 Tax=Natronorarus salvus TaxID=3117733 RepID=UPI002F2639CE
MVRIGRSLALLALCGWIGAAVSQLSALRTDDDEDASTWRDRRNRFLLLSSVATNSLAVHAVYRVAKRIRR